MVFGIIFHPSRVLEGAFEDARTGRALAVIIFTALFTGAAGYFFLGSEVAAAFLFGSSILQWFVYFLVVCFLGFVHGAKKRSNKVPKAVQVFSAVGRVWELNLFSSFLVLVMVFVSQNAGGLFLDVCFVIALFLMIVLFVAWLVSSLKMVRVVTGVRGGALVFNWLVLIVVNALLFSFVVLLVNYLSNVLLI